MFSPRGTMAGRWGLGVGSEGERGQTQTAEVFIWVDDLIGLEELDSWRIILFFPFVCLLFIF